MHASACVLKFHIRSAHSGPVRTVDFPEVPFFPWARLALHSILETSKGPGAGAPRPSLVIPPRALRPYPCPASDRLCLCLVGQNRQC